MASKEDGSEPLQDKTWVLRVFIHCEGCKKKVRRILKSVPGVITTEIDSQQNKVTVTGDVEADTLIRKLAKSGKHAELWPMEKKASNPNPNPNPSGKEKSKEKGKVVEKEKDASKSNEPTEKPEKNPEKSAAISSGTDTKPAETASKEQAPAVTKPAELDAKPAESSNKEVSKPDLKPDKAVTTSSESETKPADTATKSSDSGKKKSKNKGIEPAGNEEVFVMNSGGAPPMHQQPAYPQPVYAASYNMVHPTSSYSHYAPMPPQPQSYMYSGHPPMPPQTQSYMYSGHPLPPQDYMYPNHPPPPEYYPHYPRENYYPPENYYEHAPPLSSQSQGSYDFFSDENANSCNVM